MQSKLTMLVCPLVANVDVARVQACWRPGLLQWLARPARFVGCCCARILLVPPNLLDDSNNLLVHWHNNDEGGRGEGPPPADGCPDVEALQVKDVDGEHGAGPEADEEECEEDGSRVGSDLSSPELPDDNL